ncbi:MAG TPA: hypothetical protein VMZ91_08800 [Candidatus Paceibacterota bacterium]|nr:hypothetical protein [Candidatus Paceibacterota bacterium]
MKVFDTKHGDLFVVCGVQYRRVCSKFDDATVQVEQTEGHQIRFFIPGSKECELIERVKK